jgi:hypothetical protein
MYYNSGMNLKIAIGSILAVGILSLFATQASASEGIADMANVSGGPSHCYATSAFMQNQEYNILVICRDLLYPANAETLYYVVWAQPTAGGNPIRLGDLGLGKALYKTRTAFNRLYATQERSRDVKNPTGPVAMSGNMQPIGVLSPNSGNSAVSIDTNNQVIVTPTPTPGPSFFSRFRTGGIITVVSIIVIIVMLIVVKPFK